MEAFAPRLEVAERYLLCSMPEDAASAARPLMAQAWALSLQPPRCPSSPCTSSGAASASNLCTAPYDAVATTRFDPSTAASDPPSLAEASEGDSSVRRESGKAGTSSRREGTSEGASSLTDETAAAAEDCRNEHAHDPPSGSATSESMDPALAVECAGAVWIQALHLLNRDGEIAEGLVQVFGHLGHVPDGLLLLWVSLAMADGRCAVLKPVFSSALASAHSSGAPPADGPATPSRGPRAAGETILGGSVSGPITGDAPSRSAAASEMAQGGGVGDVVFAGAGVGASTGPTGTGSEAGAGTRNRAGAGAGTWTETRVARDKKAVGGVPRRSLQRLVEVQVALVLGQGLRDFAGAREALELAHGDRCISASTAHVLRGRLAQWEREHEQQRHQSRIKGSKASSSSGAQARHPPGRKARPTNGVPGYTGGQRNGSIFGAEDFSNKDNRNGSHGITDAEDDYDWSWRPGPGPGHRAGKSTANGISCGYSKGEAWGQGGGMGPGAKARGSRSDSRLKSSQGAQQQGQGEGRQQASGQRRDQDSVEGQGEGQGSEGRGQGRREGRGEAAVKRGAVGSWPLSLALSRLRTTMGQQWQVLWGAARAALARMEGDPSSLVSLVLAILCILAIRFRRQLVAKVQESGRSLFKVLMDAWALAFTVNLNPMVAQSAAQV